MMMASAKQLKWLLAVRRNQPLPASTGRGGRMRRVGLRGVRPYGRVQLTYQEAHNWHSRQHRVTVRLQ